MMAVKRHVFPCYCNSLISNVPFHVIYPLLPDALKIVFIEIIQSVEFGIKLFLNRRSDFEEVGLEGLLDNTLHPDCMKCIV